MLHVVGTQYISSLSRVGCGKNNRMNIAGKLDGVSNGTY